jgi:NDP-sugar pyrophosphorylase family protein
MPEHDPVMEWAPEDMAPVPLAVIGAGPGFNELRQLLSGFPEYQVRAVLDPAVSLHGQEIQGLCVAGWLGDLPADIEAVVMNTPAQPGGFDREAVFRMLLRRRLVMPILCAPDVRRPEQLILRRGTLILPGAVIERGAVIGENCLIGCGAQIRSGAVLADHQVVPAGRVQTAEGVEPGTADEHLSGVLVREEEPIQDVIQRMNSANREIILVINEQKRLQGTVTDGDIRRGILAGIRMEQPVRMIMNQDPTVVPLGTAHDEMLTIMRRRSIRHLPVVDAANHPLRLERLEQIVDDMAGNGAVVMAGGLGTRLRPLTADTPKPLLPVNGRPILDHILDGLRESGIGDVVLSVNYLGEKIREHVQNGETHDLRVNYVSERERLGTAGALSLLRPRPRRPVVVMNGDLLTHLNFHHLLRFQQQHDYEMVMCVKLYTLQVPYGVVEIKDDYVTGLREKPVHEYFINAGIYVLKPSCIDLVPENRFFDMTDLYHAVTGRGGRVGAFPIYEYWRDIGRPEDLAAASGETDEQIQKTVQTLLQHRRRPAVHVPSAGESALS